MESKMAFVQENTAVYIRTTKPNIPVIGTSVCFIASAAFVMRGSNFIRTTPLALVKLLCPDVVIEVKANLTKARLT